MRIVTLYPQQDRIIYAVNGSQGKEYGTFREKEVEQFLSKNPPGILNVILAKPELLFRKLEFPFTSRRSIKLVLPQELENVLPETPENYHYCFEFSPVARGRTIVNIYAVKNTVYSLWKNLVEKYNSKVFFFSDTILLHLFLKQFTAEKNYIAIYGIRNYLLVNLVEDGLLSGSYSYDFKISEVERIKELLSEFLSRKELRVFIIAEDEVQRHLEIPTERIGETHPLEIEKDYLFHSLLTSSPYKRPLQLKKLQHSERFPVYEAVVLMVFLGVSTFALSPYFKIPARERQIKELDKKMEETFLATCPEVRKVVNPLAQMKEKVSGKKSVSAIIAGYPSVLKIMAEITTLFPENADASVDQFIVAGNTLTLIGSTNSLKSLESIKEKIEGSGNFSIVDMGTISYDAKNRVNFNITLGIVQ